MLPFGLIIVLDVFLLSASYVMVYFSEMILRKKIPAEEYKFKIPGGNTFLHILCIVPICVAFFSFFVNGSDYFIGGFIGILTGPVLYFIWRKMYGGLSVKNPERYRKNEKTGLRQGDLKRLAFLLLLLAVLGVIAIFFMPYYEAGYSAADYFQGMFSGRFGSSDAAQVAGGTQIRNVIMLLIKIFTAVTAVTGIICAAVSSKIEPKECKIISGD